MKYCPNCNKELEDGVLFCDACGTQVPEEVAAPVAETVFCENCGQETDASAPFCQNCGAAIGAAPAPAKKKGFPKALLFGGIALVAVAAIVIALILILGGGRNNEYAIYYKEGELWFNDFSENNLEISSKLMDYDDATDESLRNGKYSDMIKMNADGKTIFYPDKYDGKGEGYTIYFRDVSKEDADATKVDSGISSYYINQKGDKIVYTKDVSYKEISEDGYTYSYSLGTIKIGDAAEAVKVASDAALIAFDEKFETVIYRTVEEGTKKEQKEGADGKKTEVEVKFADFTYYLWTEKDGKVKLCNGEISSFSIMGKRVNYSDNYSRSYEKINKFCYIKEDNLFVQESGEDAEKIDKEVTSIFKVYESGDIYYLKEGKEIKHKDLYTYEGEVSDEIKNTVMAKTEDLYCYADEESTLIVESISGYEDYAVDAAVAVINYKTYDSFKKVKFGSEDSSKTYNDNMKKIQKTAVLVDGALTEIEVEDIRRVLITDDGSSIYLVCLGTEKVKNDAGEETGDTKDKEKGEISLITVKKGEVSTPEVFDDDISGKLINYISLDRNDKLVYYKDYKEEKNKATLYIDATEIDSDVRPGSIYAMADGSYVYYCDWNNEEDKQCGTLRLSKKGEASTIAEDVHTVVITPDNEVLYLTEYNVEKSRGELWRYNGGKAVQVDEDVTAVLNIYVWEVK